MIEIDNSQIRMDYRRADYEWARSCGRTPLEALAWAYGPRPLPAARDEDATRRRWVELKIISDDFRDLPALDKIWAALTPWRVEDTDGWGDWAVTHAWPGDRERAEGWGRTAEEARQMATTRLFRAGWRADMPPEAAVPLLEEFEVIEAIEGAGEIAELLGPPETAGPIVTVAGTADVAEMERQLDAWRCGGAPLLILGEGVRVEVRPIVDAHEVVDGMLVRDSYGDYLLRFGPWGHVAYAINVRETWRSWSPPLMRWPRRGRFEVVASGLSKETPAEEPMAVVSAEVPRG